MGLPEPVGHRLGTHVGDRVSVQVKNLSAKVPPGAPCHATQIARDTRDQSRVITSPKNAEKVKLKSHRPVYRYWHNSQDTTHRSEKGGVGLSPSLCPLDAATEAVGDVWPPRCPVPHTVRVTDIVKAAGSTGRVGYQRNSDSAPLPMAVQGHGLRSGITHGLARSWVAREYCP